MTLATEEDFVVRLERRPGNYVVAGCPLALVLPGSRVTDRLTDQVRSLFVLGHTRTSNQDIEFGVNQLVEIAVRALSPGLNDPFTAITCVDHLGTALCRLATRDTPSPYRHDAQQQLRMIAPCRYVPGDHGCGVQPDPPIWPLQRGGNHPPAGNDRRGRGIHTSPGGPSDPPTARRDDHAGGS